MERQGNRLGLRLILFPAPLLSHQNSMLRLAHILYSKGFSITIIHTHLNSPNKLTHPNFKFLPIDDGLSEEEAAVTSDFVSSTRLMLKLNQSCVEPFKEGLAKLLEAAEEEEPVACLITSYIWPFTQAVADAIKLPRIVYRAESRLTSTEPDRQPIRCKDMPAILANNAEAFSNYIASIEKEAKAASGMIWNSFKELEQTQPTTITSDLLPSHLNFLIGPINKNKIPSLSSSTSDRDCISWLDSQSPNSVVYVSFGSIAALEEGEFVEMAWGLANSKQPFLWVVRPGSVVDSEWLEKLPKGFLDAVGKRGNHMIVKWAPQEEVLAHPATGCFWTHSGWNSILECICEGVPMICSPCFGDHFVSAKYVNDYWKTGMWLENGFERGEIEKAIRRIMVEREGKEMRERMVWFKEKADSCVKEGGSSFMSLEMLVDHMLSFKRVLGQIIIYHESRLLLKMFFACLFQFGCTLIQY